MNNPIHYDDFKGICKPLAEWYMYMTEDQKRNLPVRVLNALDSLAVLTGIKKS